MSWTSKELAKELYKDRYGEVDTAMGYKLQSVYNNCGVYVYKVYLRNAWVDGEIEHEVFFSKGTIYEIIKGEKKEVGTYQEIE